MTLSELHKKFTAVRLTVISQLMQARQTTVQLYELSANQIFLQQNIHIITNYKNYNKNTICQIITR